MIKFFMRDINIRKGSQWENPHFQQVSLVFGSDFEVVMKIFWDILWKV
jgi:hypothetical protein